jgi:cell volume regulation protein A
VPIEQLDTILLVGAGVLLAAILAVRVSVYAGLPSLLVYLAFGVLLGESVVGIPFEDYDLASALGYLALVLILAEGGLTTRWSQVRPAVGLGLALSTIGIAVSVLVMTVAAHALLDLRWQLALLLGAVVSATDAAAVFSVLRQVPLRPRVLGTLEAESGLNDAPVAILVAVVATGAQTSAAGWVGTIVLIVLELALGGVVGLLVGWLGARLLMGAALPASGLYPLSVLALSVLAYGGAATLHGSGFAAVYVAALVLGNSALPHRAATRSFAEGVGWLAQIGLFVMLGLLASPGRIGIREVLTALLAGGVLTLVARPLSVLTCAVWWRVSWREQAFLSWAGLRGAVPIVLATIPLAEGVDGAAEVFDVVFVLVVAFTVLQGPTLPWVARRLGVTIEGEAREVDVEAAPLGRIAAELLQVIVPADSHLHGVEIAELRLPVDTSISLVVRNGHAFVPGPTTRVQRGDELLVVSTRQARDAVEARLRSVSLHGRLAGWQSLAPGGAAGEPPRAPRLSRASPGARRRWWLP